MPRPPKEQRNKDMVKKYLQGMSLRELGDYFGLHHSTVAETLMRWLPIYGPDYPKLWEVHLKTETVKQ